jgi:hypothetical protein
MMVYIGLKEGYKVFAVVYCPPSCSCQLCYKFLMKIIEQWVLFKYVGGQFTPQSKPFKTKDQAEKARLKLTEREQREAAVGVIRIKK